MMYKNTQSTRRWRTGGLRLGLVILLGLVVLSCGPGYSEAPTGGGTTPGGGGGSTPGGGGNPGGGGTTPGGGGGSTPGGGGTPPTPPPPPPPPPFSAALIAAGNKHSCAVSGGQAFCWGDDGAGRLGDGTTVTAGVSSTADQDKPAEVWAAGTAAIMGSTFTGLDKITAGGAHTCALRSTQAFCWGKNSNGQLGTGVTIAYNMPPPSPQHSPVAVWGVGGTTMSPGTFTGLSAISAGKEHTCVLRNTRAFCWGKGDEGRLGNSSSVNKTTPVAVLGVGRGSTSRLTRVSAITAGSKHTCAVYDFVPASANLLPIADMALCWGKGDEGRLGGGSQAAQYGRYNPGVVLGVTGHRRSRLANVSAIAAGDAHTCAVRGGQAFCWGKGDDGRLGNGGMADKNVPVVVWDVDGTTTLPGTLIGIDRSTAGITAGFTHTCALLLSGQAVCWGKGDSGQLGDGASTNQDTPVNVLAVSGTGSGMLTGVTAITAGFSHTCALLLSGQALCWGSDDDGRLGNGMSTSNGMTNTSPKDIPVKVLE